MKKTILILILSVFISLISYGFISTDKDFIGRESEIGLISVVDSLTARKKSGPSDDISVVLTSHETTIITQKGSKGGALSKEYDEELFTIPEQLNIVQKSTDEVIKAFASVNKKVKVINNNIPIKQFLLFKENQNKTSNNKKYYPLELRNIKSKYKDMKEVIIIKNSYGLYIDYYKIMKSGNGGFSDITLTVVDLNDNSIKFETNSITNANLSIKWNAPSFFKNLKNSIQKAIDKNSEKIGKKVLKEYAKRK